MRKNKYFCPCCGFKTLGTKPPGTYEICEICFWEDDDLQFNDPDMKAVQMNLLYDNIKKVF